MVRPRAGDRGGYRAREYRARSDRPDAALAGAGGRGRGRGTDRRRSGLSARRRRLPQRAAGGAAERRFRLDADAPVPVRRVSSGIAARAGGVVRCPGGGDRRQGRQGGRLSRRTLGRSGDPAGRRHRGIASADAGGAGRSLALYRGNVRRRRCRSGDRRCRHRAVAGQPARRLGRCGGFGAGRGDARRARGRIPAQGRTARGAYRASWLPAGGDAVPATRLSGTALVSASVAEVLDWLGEVPDPEIPVVSVVDLGIVRDVAWRGEELVVTVTPTYSGCPATAVISLDIEACLRAHGIARPRIERRLAPPWTTDWVAPAARERLREFGIAPPVPGTAAQGRLAARAGRLAGGVPAAIACPRCGSTDTETISRFGSTPCKAACRCNSCLEPFDYFKCI
ncbi:MAG: phenylacetate-CoA oxygenase subunit PaaJ [Rhodospirillales bacterium]|nr:phenylacetate-CoA oxygenase subunit PaaJ [Rhodospirillales bacterium]